MSNNSLPLEEWCSQAREWARHAGAIQRRYYHDPASKNIEHKGEIDLVTAADKECEAYLVEEIQRAHPTHGYVCEEGHEKTGDSGLTWHVDPLDGTTNFSHGYPVFCVSIALARGDDVLLGVIYDPMRDELFSAVQGGGAYMNELPIHVTGEKRLEKSLLVSGFPYSFASDDRNLKLWGAFLKSSLSVRRDGSAALDLCYVACGRFEGFWEFGLNPWDVAAGTLIVNEAGGRSTNFDGTPLILNGRNILATNGWVHAPMQQVLRDNGAL